MCSRRLLAAFNVRPFAPCWQLLWPRLTSALASRHLSMSVARRLPSAPVQISPGMAHSPSRLCLSDLRHGVPYKFRALTILAASPHHAASYPLPVRQASALPSASSRFTVTHDTLAVQLTLPLVGRVEDFHLQVSAPCRAHQKNGPPKRAAKTRNQSPDPQELKTRRATTTYSLVSGRDIISRLTPSSYCGEKPAGGPRGCA